MAGLIATILLFVQFFFPSNLSAADPSSGSADIQERGTADEIIERYIAACGGPALEKIQCETRKGTLLRGRTGKVPLVIHSRFPGKWHYIQTFAWGDQVAFGSDGVRSWIQDTREVRPMDPGQETDMKLLLDVRAPMMMKELYPSMEIRESEDPGAGEVTSVAAVSRDGVETELVFDDSTGLLVKAGSMQFEDYREVGGVKRPFRIILGADDGERMKLVMELSEINHDGEIDGSCFEKPLCVLPYAEAPLYREQVRIEVSQEKLDALVGAYRDKEKSDAIYRVSRQGKHLMFCREGGPKLEIIPKTETDYYMWFMGYEFHFQLDSSGDVLGLILDIGRIIETEKIE